jgi:lysophospholipase L1-like esterase
MKAFLTLALAALCLNAPLRADSVLKPDDVVAINGDSITAQQMYSVFIAEYLLACQPVPHVRSVNFGVGGTTAGYFKQRVESDILPFKPTVATMCYGMNDGHYVPIAKENQDAYRNDLTAAIKKLKAAGVRTILVGGPGAVDGGFFKKPGATTDEYNATLKDFTDIAAGIAKSDGDIFVDVHGPMLEAMDKEKAANGPTSMSVNSDGVHPSPMGHLPMAYAFLKAMGCDGAIGTITVDLAANSAEGTPGQKIVSVKDGSVMVESTRYPFCFVGTINAAKMLPYLPFNQDLNRYLLVVKGLKTAKAKVTWGTDSKEFAAADLAKGVNLADEFLQNPLCHAFEQLQAMVLVQQSSEITIVSSILHNVPNLKNNDKANAVAYDQLGAPAMDLLKKLSDLSSSHVVPVTHTIKIELAQ